MHFLLRDEALGLALADLGLALVVDDDDRHLGAAEAWQPLALGERQRQIGTFVDDLEHGLHGCARIEPGLRDRTRQRIEHAHFHLLLRFRSRRTCEQGGACERDHSRCH